VSTVATVVVCFRDDDVVGTERDPSLFSHDTHLWVLVIVDSPGASVDNKMVHMLSTNEAESGELLDDQEGDDSDDGERDTCVPLQSA
jgi:hypothetical protein